MQNQTKTRDLITMQIHKKHTNNEHFFSFAFHGEVKATPGESTNGNERLAARSNCTLYNCLIIKVSKF